MTTLTSGNAGNVSVMALAGGAGAESHEIAISTPTRVKFQFDLGDGVTRTWDLFGTGFTYDDFGDPAGGTITRWRETIEGGQRSEWRTTEYGPLPSGGETQTGPDIPGGTRFEIRGFSVDMDEFMAWAASGSGDLDLLKDRVFAGNDILTGGSRDWTITILDPESPFEIEVGDQLRGYGGDDILNGGGGFDYLMGDEGNDSLNGGAGNDVLDGGAGNDRMNGAAGDDAFVVDSASDTVKETGGGGTDTIGAYVSYTLPANVENLVLLGTRNINGTGDDRDNDLRGNAGRNVLTGLGGKDNLGGDSGNDALSGGAGNDNLDGGAGSDKMAGGAGNDTYHVDSSGDVIVESAAAGTDDVWSSVDYTLAPNLENLRLVNDPGDGDLEGIGNARANAIDGSWGNDTLLGLGGNDALTGADGEDVLLGGSGNDKLEGGNDDDLLVGSGGNDNLLGDQGDDTLIGGAGTDTMSGGSGNDTLKGGADTDSLDGGAGSDILVWDEADSSVNGGSEEGASDIDTLQINGNGSQLNLDSLDPSLIQSIEVIRFKGFNSTLALDLDDVVNLSSTTDVLRVDGTGDAVLALDAQQWTHVGNTEANGNTYRVFQQETAQLWLDTDLLTNIPIMM